jgi:SAM-dependent methyltransferase
VTPRIALPYFDNLLEGLSAGHPEITTAFGRHVHWGYWSAQDRPDGSAADFAAAAERLCRRVCDAGGARDGQRILDVGCGFGGTVASLNERFSGVDLCGLNIDARQLERARQEVRSRPGNRVDFHEGDACRMPFADASFDVVLAVECAFHFPSRARFLREAARVLRPGGRLSLCDFVPSGPAVPLLRFQDRIFGAYIEKVSGAVDVGCTLSAYRALGRAASLEPRSEEDITLNTLPTYPVLRRLIRSFGVQVPTATFGATALSWVSRLKLLRYVILAFDRA